jgi:transposase InsO family protein
MSGQTDVSEACELLDVTRSGYYAWRHRDQGARALRNEVLCKLIAECFQEHKGTYGSPRITETLRQRGEVCNRKRIERLMRENGHRVRPKRSWRPCTTDSKHDHPIAPNLLLDRPAVKGANEVWVTDITYLRTNEGWLYLAGVLDLWSRKLIGWSMQDHLGTSLPKAALEMALVNRGHPRGVIHHSDRGCQYASQEYRSALSEAGLIASMSRRGNCYDNATMESFWSTLKGEAIENSKELSPTAVRQIVFEFIEAKYNRTRLHSSLGYKSPVDFEKQLK